MIISERHKRTSTCDFKCDKCGKEWTGNFYVMGKKDIHLCQSCSMKKGWKNKHKIEKKKIPDNLKEFIVKRIDNISLDEHFPKNKTLKIIVKCQKCNRKYQSNAYDILKRNNTLCNSCIQKEVIVDYSYRKTKEYKENMRNSILNSQKYKDSYDIRSRKHKEYWEKIRGCKLADILTEWELYRRTIYRMSESTYRKHKDIINPNKVIRGRGKYHLDHKYSVMIGFKNNIPPFVLSHFSNLQMLKEKDNIAKDYRCDITKEELFKGVFCSENQI